MSNNKEIICKLIKAKNQEANSYTDQTCYNAAYCFERYHNFYAVFEQDAAL